MHSIIDNGNFYHKKPKNTQLLPDIYNGYVNAIKINR